MYLDKDFDNWNKLKKKINKIQRKIYFKEGQIWWANLGINVGTEQNGGGIYYERPVLIIKKFSSKSLLCLPMTTKNKIGSYYYNLEKDSVVILYQAKLLDSKRLNRQIKKIKISKLTFRKIVNSFKELL